MSWDIISVGADSNKVIALLILKGLNNESLNKQLIRNHKIAFEMKLARKYILNHKSFHSYIRSKKEKTKDVIAGLLRDSGGKLIDSSKETVVE